MKKYLLGAMAIAAMFASACKKGDLLTETTTQGENQRTTIGNPEPDPIPVTTPTVFFLKGNLLWSIKNITSTNPTLKQEGQVTGISFFDNITKANIFNNTSMYQDVFYDKATDRMLAIDDNLNLNKCFVSTKGTSKLALPNINVSPAVALGMGPDNKLYYHCYNYPNPNDIESPADEQIRRINTNGSGEEVVFTYTAGQKGASWGGAINFNKNVVYSADYITGNIYETSLSNNLSESKLIVPAIFGETFEASTIRYDSKNKFLYFSSKIKSKNLLRIYRMDPSIGLSSIKVFVETPMDLSSVPEFGGVLNFDISPITKTLFWCKVVKNNQTYTSTITKVDLTNTNINTNFKVLATGNFYSGSIVVAEPAN